MGIYIANFDSKKDDIGPQTPIPWTLIFNFKLVGVARPRLRVTPYALILEIKIRKILPE